MLRRVAIASFVCALAATGVARAQGTLGEDAPDLRGIEPFMMLIMDTSGSMEKLPSCSVCPSCNKCQPDCTVPNVGGVSPPQKKNRWSIALEALTGVFQDYECTQLNRTLQNGMSYDIGYLLAYHQPWKCWGATPGSACGHFGGTCLVDNDCSSPFKYCVSGRCQTFKQNPSQPGVLDVYRGQVRFGLMTFDGMDSYFGAPPLVPASNFNIPLSEGKNGLWSYGGPKEFHYPNCVTDFMMDTGVRSALAEEGKLITITAGTSLAATNDAIQEALFRTRPFGSSPVAASLDDLYHHLKNDVDDGFAQCRGSYALLLTDGSPDRDYRQFGCDCTHNDPNGPSASYCGPPGPLTNPADMKCPYPLPTKAAHDLVFGKAGDADGVIEKLFVVGFAIDDVTVVDELDAIAMEGGSNQALIADNQQALIDQIATILDTVIRPVSRSVPAFVAGTDVPQFQIIAGFETTAAGLRAGRIERRRFTCDLNDTANPTYPVKAEQLSEAEGDLFHVVLDAQAERNLLTVLPSTSANGYLYSAAGQPCGATGCNEVPLETAQYTQLGVDAADADEVLDWVYGRGNSVRNPASGPGSTRLGEVRYSSPIVVGTPDADTEDEAFNIWRRRLWGTASPGPLSRPLMLYVGSNDGILHGFSVEDWAAPFPSTETLDAGEEVFGFIPPMLLDDLQTSLTANQFTMNGTVVAKDVYFQRELMPSDTADNYRTVLITGMRNGGKAYIALDVTDPLDPQFLWQFTDPNMGYTFAQPAVVQAIYTRDEGGSQVVRERAVAILPGGVGEVGDSGLANDCVGGETGTMPNPVNGQGFKTKNALPEANPHSHRTTVRCWKDIGRALYFVDVETGELIKKIHRVNPSDPQSAPVFPSPLVSTPAAYRDGIGTLASRAFIVDADGVIWRVDTSAIAQKPTIPTEGWTARPFHDIFWDAEFDEGELSYEAPILSTDEDGNLVVIVGTGDTNDFTKDTVRNRVVSLTETINQTLGSGPERWQAKFNWEKRVQSSPTKSLVQSELVTGPMVLFEGQLFFGTFISFNPGGEVCDLGRGRLFGVHYRDFAVDSNGNPSTPNGALPETYGPKELPVADTADAFAPSLFNILDTQAQENLLVMGLSLATRPNCFVVDAADSNVLDPLSGGKMAYASQNPVGSAVYLVAQASGDWDVQGDNADKPIKLRAGSGFGQLELKVRKQAALTRILSWATSVE